MASKQCALVLACPKKCELHRCLGRTPDNASTPLLVSPCLHLAVHETPFTTAPQHLRPPNTSPIDLEPIVSISLADNLDTHSWIRCRAIAIVEVLPMVHLEIEIS